MFLQYFDTVGWVLWPVKTVTRITYTVLVETLNPAQSINQTHECLGISLHVVEIVFLHYVSVNCFKSSSRQGRYNCGNGLRPIPDIGNRHWTLSISRLSICISDCRPLTDRHYWRWHRHAAGYRHLVKAGLLLTVSADTWWSLGIPTLHMFTKTFSIGRKALLTIVNKCKYYEITEQVGVMFWNHSVLFSKYCFVYHCKWWR